MQRPYEEQEKVCFTWFYLYFFYKWLIKEKSCDSVFHVLNPYVTNVIKGDGYIYVNYGFIRVE